MNKTYPISGNSDLRFLIRDRPRKSAVKLGGVNLNQRRGQHELPEVRAGIIKTRQQA